MKNIKLENAVQKYDPVLDIVPVQIDARTVIEAGYSKESSLVKFCKERNVTVRELREMSALRDKYKTNLITLANLRDEGCSIEKVGQLLEIREGFKGEPGMPSLTNILKFTRVCSCSDEEEDTNYIVDMIKKIHRKFGDKFYSQPIDYAVEVAEEFGICLEHVGDLIEARGNNFRKGIRDSPRPLLPIKSDDYSEDSFRH